MSFRITYHFVDDTYWDDGNRTTSRTKEVASYSDAVDFVRSIVKKGTIETSRETGKSKRFHIDKKSVRVSQVTTRDYPWWYILDDFEYIVDTLRKKLERHDFAGLASFEQQVVEFYDRDHWKRALTKVKEDTP